MKNFHTTSRDYVQYLATGLHTPNICFNGASNCNFQAEVAYSVDSLYDIPFATLPILFDKHGLKELYATMLIPDTVSHSSHYVLESCASNWYHIQIVGNELNFYLDDCNPVYSHNYYNLRKYIYTTYIVTPEYIITSEIIRSSNILKMFRFVKIPIPSGLDELYNLLPEGYLESVGNHFRRQVPISNDNVYYVPNMVHKAKNTYSITNQLLIIDDDYVVENGKTSGGLMLSKSFAIPKDVVDKLSKWFMTQDGEKLTFTNFAIYFRSVTTTITINSQTIINPGWQPDQKTYFDSLLSLYIILYSSRARTMLHLNELKSGISSEKNVDTAIGQNLELLCRRISSLFKNGSNLQDTTAFKRFVFVGRIAYSETNYYNNCLES